MSTPQSYLVAFLFALLKVVEEKIQHITWSPASPEPYYISTGKELRPQPVGEDAGTVIYQYYPMSAVNYVSSRNIFQV